jgi:hypothetical protein
MGWISEEFDRYKKVKSGSEADPGERRLEAVAEQLWIDLREALKTDVAEFSREGGQASFESISEKQIRISDADRGLSVLITADPVDHNIRYEFESTQSRVASPEGGFFSLRISPSGRGQIFSADQQITSEEARRTLLQPVFFPSEPSESLQQSA